MADRKKARQALEQLGTALTKGTLDLGGLPLAGPAVDVVKGAFMLGQAAFGKAAARSAEETERLIDALPAALAEIERLRSDLDEAEKRSSLALRMWREAGRHPAREMHLAFGRFAARVLIEGMDDVDALELAQALADMTALDLAAIEAVHEDSRLNDYADLEKVSKRVSQRPAFSGLEAERLSGKPTPETRIRTEMMRLDGMRLTKRHGDAWTLTRLGRLLVAATRDPTAADPDALA